MTPVPHTASLGGQGRLSLLSAAPLALLGAVAYIPALLTFLDGLLADGIVPTVVIRDFANYWMGGRLTLAGEQRDLFTQAVYFARLQEVFGADYPIHNWSYPPHVLLLLWPLGLLDYRLALILFLVVSGTLFAVSLMIFRANLAPNSKLPLLFLAVVAYAMMMIDTAQNGFLTAAALLLGLAWTQSRPMLAGVAFAFLTIKPQLGILIPLLLLFDRNWRTIGWCALFSCVLVALSAAVFGVDSWIAYLTETLAYQRYVMTDWYGIFLRMMPTMFASVRTLGFHPSLATVAQWPVSLLGLALVVWLFWKERSPLKRAFALTCGTFLVSPYAFNYDMGAVTVVAALLVGSERFANRYTTIAVSLVAALSAVVMNLGRAGLPISPLLLAAAMVAIAIETWRLTSNASDPNEPLTR